MTTAIAALEHRPDCLPEPRVETYRTVRPGAMTYRHVVVTEATYLTTQYRKRRIWRRGPASIVEVTRCECGADHVEVIEEVAP